MERRNRYNFCRNFLSCGYTIGKTSEISVVTRANLSDVACAKPSVFRKCAVRSRLAIRLRLLPSYLPYETKRFLPAERSHNRWVLARARFSVPRTIIPKKASSDYAHLIGWDSHGNCEVNWFLMMGPPIATAISRASSLCLFFSLLLFFSFLVLPSTSCISFFLFLYLHALLSSNCLRNLSAWL